MNGDLISRSAVIDVIKRHECNTIRIMEGVMELPTAYDVDKVVERLEEYAHSNICESHNGCPYICNEDMNCDNCGAMGALEIVKSGGIE